MASDEKWIQVKRKMQAKWGIQPAEPKFGPSWTGLADRVRDRAVRVGSHLIDLAREAAKETTATLSEAGEVLQGDATRVGKQVKSAGGKAKLGIDSARNTLEELADSVRDGLVDGVKKAQTGKDVPRALAETVGAAAGALLAAVKGQQGGKDRQTNH